MAPNTDQPERRAAAVERHLSKRADEGASCAELAAILQDYRTACEAFTSANFGCDATHDTEQKLWAAHLKVNTIFRQEHKILKRNRENVVEIRKFHKLYLHFIKASQRFYRQHILDLDAQFDGIPELRKIAHKWKDDTSKQASRQRIPSAQRNQVLLSCHQTLIHLGDLSRYRETELVDKDDKERNWGPAKGYYGLAAEIYPDSGHAHNQLAVISREDGDHFRSVYHLYRSLATKLPYPQAKANLELEFKRVISAWEKGQLINNHKSTDGNNSGRALIAWFIRLHSRIYKGEEFAAHDELEGEVLSHLAIELKERPLDSILTKIILINFAAEYFATVQMQSQAPPPNIMRTYFFYLRLNVKTFFILLQVLQPELERLSEGDDVKNQNGDCAPQLSDKITAVARRILPGLRLYSTWFTRYWKVLNANIADTLTTVDVQELWKAYAATLTLLASSFPVEKLPTESYMLEEDTETIAFQPLLSPDTMKVWYDGESQKQKWTDLERNHPNVEMLMRIKDLLIDGLLLTQNPEAPLDLDVTRFIYREEGLPSELLASPNTHPDHSPIRSPQMEVTDIPLFPAEKVLAEDQKSHSVTAASESASTTMAKDNAMLRMVDDLVGPDDGLDPLVEEDEDVPPTPPPQIFEDTTLSPGPFSITDLVSNVKNYKSVSPSPGHRMMATPMGRSGSTSSMRLPANLPSLPDGSSNSAGNSIWNLQYNGTPGPSSPMRPNSHARGDSNTSLLGVEGFSTPHSGFNSDPTWGTNSATWGNGYNNNSGVNHYNTTLASPLMFQSSLQHNAHSSWRHTPPNGQGG